MTENALQRKILLDGSSYHSRMWRNNVGVALYESRGRKMRVRYGLAPGSADIIGIRSVKITPDMVGKRIGQFVALEIKGKGRNPTEAQKNFLSVVRNLGGDARVVRGEDDFLDLVNPPDP